MPDIQLPPNETQLIVNAITQRFGPCSVYAFGYGYTGECHHFFILVCSQKAIPGLGVNIANAINEQSGTRGRVTLLLHKPKDMFTKQSGQQFFFDWVLRNGQRLTFDKNHPPYVLNNAPKRDIESDRLFWLKCEAVAQFYLHAAASSPHEEVGLCKVALLHTSVLQIALGLIRVFLGYTPNEYSLNFLLQLCGHFTDLPAQTFPATTPDEVRRYKMLCAPPSVLNHRIRLHADEKDFEYLLAACESFIEKATAQGNTTLSGLILQDKTAEQINNGNTPDSP